MPSMLHYIKKEKAWQKKYGARELTLGALASYFFCQAFSFLM